MPLSPRKAQCLGLRGAQAHQAAHSFPIWWGQVMTTELVPLGVRCNLSCTYCYQHPMRDAGNIGDDRPYDFDKMFAALKAEGSDFLVFGGEPLLVPLVDLECIWAWGFERFRKNGVQTNGVLITPEHIEAFKRYNVHVGFSMDGPDELNDSRWAGTLDRTREATKKSHANMAACIAADVAVSIIITLYKGNATPERLPQLMQWIRDLDALGVRGVRIHLLEVDHPLVRERMQLSERDTIAALRALVALDRESLSKQVILGRFPTLLEAETKLQEAKVSGQIRVQLYQSGKAPPQYTVWSDGLPLDILTDMRALLRVDDDHVTCVWNVCDPYSTSAVRGVDGQGNRTNCGRTNKDGIAKIKADQPGFERQVALYHTSYEANGCQGCRFFLMCKGQCPGTAIDGDWRNRTQDCRIWMSLFETLEQEMLDAGELPLSLSPDRLRLEPVMLDLWGRGQTMSLKAALGRLNSGQQVAPSLDSKGHGDSPHGDVHGDHTDDGNGFTPRVQAVRVNE